jgi:hypothetical protein
MLGLDKGVFYKDCVVCKDTLPAKKFRLRTDNKNHQRRPYCLPCEKVKFNTRYKQNRVSVLNTTKQYTLNHYEQKILNQAKKTAQTKNLEFDLTIEDIKIPAHCKYLGIELTKILGSGVVWSNCSIDRIDSSKGYIKGNVEIISRKANSMKNMATEKELIVFAKNILKIYKE